MRFPKVTGYNLNDELFQLPQDFAGKLNLVAVAFTEWQQAVVDSWAPQLKAMEAEDSRLRFYEVPTIFDMPPAQRIWLDNVMKAGIQDPRTRAITITVYVDILEFLRELELPTDRKAYLLLVDNDGRVYWHTSGPYSPHKMARLRQTIRQVLDGEATPNSPQPITRKLPFFIKRPIRNMN